MNHGRKILIVDDDRMSRLLLNTILSRISYRVSEAFDGEDCLEKAELFCPDLILMDVGMPGMDGLDVTRLLKNNDETKNIPVMIISGHDDLEERVRAVEAGAEDFLSKPVEQTILKAKVKSLLKIKEYNDNVHNYQKKLEKEVEKKTSNLKQALDDLQIASEKLRLYSMDTILRLSQAAEYKDTDTGEHIQRISYYIQAIGKAMTLSDEEIEAYQYASPMHDVGKIGIPDHILMKPGPLDDSEWEIMKQHTVIGGKILGGSDSSILKTAETIALTHHEKWNGSGYPYGLKGLDIPMAGRITAIADVFDALTSKRPYKEAFSVEKAFEIMAEDRGKSFDPELLDAFFSIKAEIAGIRNTNNFDHKAIIKLSEDRLDFKKLQFFRTV
ncbi:MAG: HD domain-containing phosphohydrolase [Thermodesulfobacteriota bacterium]